MKKPRYRLVTGLYFGRKQFCKRDSVFRRGFSLAGTSIIYLDLPSPAGSNDLPLRNGRAALYPPGRTLIYLVFQPIRFTPAICYHTAA